MKFFSTLFRLVFLVNPGFFLVIFYTGLMTLKQDLAIIVGALVLLFIGWVASGGPEQAKQTGSAQDKFIEPLDPRYQTGTYNERIWDPEKGVWQNPTLRNYETQ